MLWPPPDDTGLLSPESRMFIALGDPLLPIPPVSEPDSLNRKLSVPPPLPFMKVKAWKYTMPEF